MTTFIYRYQYHHHQQPCQFTLLLFILQVEYSIGAKQQPLPANLMADLDSALIPSINAAAMKHRRGPLTVELFFSVVSLF